MRTTLGGTFVPLALASRKNEAWVADRTGHRSSQMIARYRRRALLATELELGWFKPLHEVVPEIAEEVSRTASDDIASAECPVIAPEVRGTHSGGRHADEEKASDGAGFGRVGHDGLEPAASGARVPIMAGHVAVIT